MADSLTDEQLVAELESYGEKVPMPIKASRRPILMKKLNHLRSRNRPAAQKVTSRQLTGRHELHFSTFSSDDSDAESDYADNAAGTSQAASSNTGLRHDQVSNTVSAVVNKTLRRRSRLNLTPASVNVRGRNSDTGIVGSPSPSTNNLNKSRSFTSSGSATGNASHQNLGRTTIVAESAFDEDASSSQRQCQMAMPSFESSDSDVDEGISYEVVNKSVNTSFGLTSSRQRSSMSNHVSPSRSVSKSDQNHTMKHSSSQQWKYQKRRLYPEHVSFCLVAVGLAFFLILCVCYMVVRKELFSGLFFSDSSSQVKDSTSYLLCTDRDTKESGKCYRDEELLEATKILNGLRSELSYKKGRFVCGYDEQSEYILKAETWKKDLKPVSLSAPSLNVSLLYNCCLDLIISNPSWNILALTEAGDPAQNISSVFYLESAVASMGLFCRLHRSISRVIWGLFVTITGVAGLGGVLLILWWRIQAKEKEEQAVFTMVEQIIDLLKKQYESAQSDDTGEPSALAVQHVRDQILPPSRRKPMKHIWDKAVKFIEANESRVRLETKVIEGEEYDAWRWIQTGQNGGKVWQGQAFGEHNDSNASAAIYSPTPCLKIRNMFDKEVESGENWEENVKDALLEKCQIVKSLVHIFVDKDSREGCVYVKCSSKEAAGQVKQALHGWWFDGRLVTVKHLKLEHYHHRWPEAKNALRPLQPSTNQMRSLAQPYHRSSLEMT